MIPIPLSHPAFLRNSLSSKRVRFALSVNSGLRFQHIDVLTVYLKKNTLPALTKE
jgi:hypothetical protein